MDLTHYSRKEIPYFIYNVMKVSEVLVKEAHMLDTKASKPQSHPFCQKNN